MERKPIEIKPLFTWGQIVYIKTDVEQLPRIVTGYTLRPSGNILYEITQGTEETPHFAFELSDTINKELLETYKTKD